MSGSSAARIVASDVLAKNGVVHVIDGVLANTASDPAAASSAYASATSVAAQTVTETGPVGGPTASRATRVSTSGSITISAGGLTSTLCAVAGVLAGGILAI
ncbi:hypothetical protein PILCRDRAFT_17194 [Piloderma croceum F 1598]|uniref:FAS1 domain-containing protein n=1 Tax=Piloderma croceum (strain F 1598) TaxID=765440 RepID=A0A0C3ET75_PILCF|nr:hypothetical protein PILCRDRAFT_17194 [Piloderma croceum F 1598]